MSNSSLIHLIRSSIPLSDDAINEFIPFLHRFEYKKDYILSNENDKQEYAFIIESGEIGCFKKHKDIDNYEQLHILKENNISGFLHLLDNDPCFYTLKVLSQSSIVWRISQNDFKELFNNDIFRLSWLHFIHNEVRKQSKLIRTFNRNTKDNDKLTIIFYDSTSWTFEAFDKPEYHKEYNLKFIPERLDNISVSLAHNCDIVCVFVNDILDNHVLSSLHSYGIKMIALRCAGFDKVNVEHAKIYNMTVARVPAYSPYAVAEHAIALLLSLNRKVHRAYQRTRDVNFQLSGFIGFDLHGKTAGIIGTGKIGRCLVSILLGFGCKIICYDIYPSKEYDNNPNVTYVELDYLYANSDFISLHLPATKETYHMINKDSINKMKDNVFIINTSRGHLINSRDLLDGITSCKIGAVGLDVYEGEASYFFKDNSERIIADNTLRELLSHPNVIVTGHQAFLTKEAITNIANTTFNNIKQWKEGKTLSSHPNSIY